MGDRGDRFGGSPETYRHTHTHTHTPVVVVEVDVGASLEVFSGDRGLLVSLKPSHVVFMESPRVPLQLARCQVLLIGTLQRDKHTGVRTSVLPAGTAQSHRPAGDKK